MTSIREQWEQGVAPELAYWRDWLANSGHEVREEYDRMISADSAFQFTEDLAGGADAVRVLDVGAGPITKVGKLLPDRAVDIRAMDYLAHAYNALLDELRLAVPVRTEFGLAERLSKDHPVDFYDVVACSSALDHFRDPVRSIAEMISVCRPGGNVFISVQRNEGERNAYGGFHNWNFDRDADDRVILWNRYARFDIFEMFGAVAAWTVHYTVLPDTTWISMRAKKTVQGGTSVYM